MSFYRLKDYDRYDYVDSFPIISIDSLLKMKKPFGIGVMNIWHWHRPMSYLSLAIRQMRNCMLNHFMTCSIHGGVQKVTEANHKGVNPKDLLSKIDNWRIYDDQVLIYVPKKPLSTKEVTKRSEDMWGVSYAFFGLVQFAWATLTRNPVRSRSLREEKVYTCTTQFMKALTKKKDFWTYTPKEIQDSDLFIIYKLDF